MRKYLFFVVLCILASVTAMAVPAMPGFEKVRQSDGTTLMVQSVGDEWYSLLLTADGLVVDLGDDGDLYYVTTTGMSEVKAHEATQRDMAEISFVNANRAVITADAVKSVNYTSTMMCNIHIKGVATSPRSGSPRIPVILVEFSDKQMSHDREDFVRQLASQSGNKSAWKYFRDQSNGDFTPRFDVYGVYNLGKPRAHYGADGATRDMGDWSVNNMGRAKVVEDAILKAANDIDWSLYDNADENGRVDGTVDGCIVIFAGVGQAQSKLTKEALWPCRWNFQNAYGSALDVNHGKSVNDFAIINEIGGSNDEGTQLDGIGTFCHEFSHCLGLPDFYVTGSDGSSNTGLDDWSIMANGCYENGHSSNTPVGYSAFEKHYMGWMDYIEPEPCSLHNLPIMNNVNNPNDQAVVIRGYCNKSSKYEYWVIENRSSSQLWDQNIPSSGVLISHYIYDEDKWIANHVNYLGSLQEAEIVGDGYGYFGKTSFTDDSNPAMIAQLNAQGGLESAAMGKPVTDIKINNDGTASLWYMKDVRSFTVSTEEIAMRSMIGETQRASFNISGKNLVEDVTLTLDDPNGVFTLSDNHIGKSEAEAGKTVNVMFKSDNYGVFTGTITVKCGDFENTIQLSGLASAGDTAFDTYLDITKHSTIDEAGVDVYGMSNIYQCVPDEYGSTWLTLSCYGAMKADGTQNWYETDASNLRETTGSWQAIDIFPAHTAFFTSSGYNVKQAVYGDATETFYVTNCSQVKVLDNGIYNESKATLSIYECTKNGDGTLTASTMAIDTKESATTGKEVFASSDLDPSKIYKVQLKGGGIYPDLYAIGFKISQNITALRVSPKSMSFTAKPGVATTDTINVKGNLLAGDVNVTFSGDNNVFSVSRTSIGKAEAEAGTQIVVTFNSQSEGNFNGTVTLTSGDVSATVELDGKCSDGGTASDSYLNIAKFSTIDEVVPEISNMNSIYKYTPQEDYAWLTISAYGAMKAAQTQEWYTCSFPTNSYKTTWASTDIFPGDDYYFSTADGYAAYGNGNETFYVTNCSQVKVYDSGVYGSYKATLSIYECIEDTDGSLIASPVAFDTQVSSLTTVEVITSNVLDPSKIYKVQVSGTGNYPDIYEIGFQTPLTGSTPVLPASLTASPATLNFNVMEEESVSDTINVTGENLTGDVAVTLTDENHAFSIGTTSITKAEAEAGYQIVVTFNPQEAGSYTGTVTLASGNLTQTVALNGEAEAKPQVNEPELTTNPASLSFSTYAGYEATNTLVVSGQWISDDVIVTCQGEGFYVSTDTIAASNLAEGSVEVAVTFRPMTEGSYEGTVTLTCGSTTHTVALNGEATYNVQTPHAIAATEIAQRSFVANWNADSCLGATSYTLRVIHEMFKLVPKPSNTTTLLLSEDFGNCNNTNDEITDADTDNSGWTGIRVYVDNSAVRIGGSSTGTLTSPDLDLSNSNRKVSVRFLAKTYSKPGNYQYQSENNPLKISCNGGESQTITVPSTTYEEFTVVLPCEKAVSQKITFANTRTKANVIIDSVRIYAGDITVASLPAGFDTGHNGTLPGSVGSGLGSGFSSGFEVVVVRDTTIYTGITENHYKLTGLAPMNNYTYDVKAVYGNQESGWSNSVGVITKKKFTPLDDLVVNGRVGHEFVINDDLIVVHVKGSDGLMWCKSVNNTSVDATEIRSGQVDYMRDVVGEQISEWDQSNWILLQFPADDGTNGIKDMLEDAVGKIIPGGSVAGIYTDEVNYSMAVLPVDNAYTLELGDEVSYTKNLYCTANFLPSNLNINGGNGALGHIGGNDVYYFFMNPKVQEVCEITAAEFDADGVFVNPFSNGQVSGSIKVDWSYNAEGVQSPEKGKVYSFMAVVNRELGSDGTYNYIVYPLNFTTSGSAVTGIGSIDGSREAVSVEYVNTAGLVSDKPFKGVNIVVTRYSDGSKKVTKELYK